MKPFDASLRLEGLPLSPGIEWYSVPQTDDIWVLELTDTPSLSEQVGAALTELLDLRKQFTESHFYLHLNVSAQELKQTIKLEPSFLKLLVTHDVTLEFWSS